MMNNIIDDNERVGINLPLSMRMSKNDKRKKNERNKIDHWSGNCTTDRMALSSSSEKSNLIAHKTSSASSYFSNSRRDNNTANNESNCDFCSHLPIVEIKSKNPPEDSRKISSSIYNSEHRRTYSIKKRSASDISCNDEVSPRRNSIIVSTSPSPTGKEPKSQKQKVGKSDLLNNLQKIEGVPVSSFSSEAREDKCQKDTEQRQDSSWQQSMILSKIKGTLTQQITHSSSSSSSLRSIVRPTTGAETSSQRPFPSYSSRKNDQEDNNGPTGSFDHSITSDSDYNEDNLLVSSPTCSNLNIGIGTDPEDNNSLISILKKYEPGNNIATTADVIHEEKSHHFSSNQHGRGNHYLHQLSTHDNTMNRSSRPAHNRKKCLKESSPLYTQLHHDPTETKVEFYSRVNRKDENGNEHDRNIPSKCTKKSARSTGNQTEKSEDDNLNIQPLPITVPPAPLDHVSFQYYHDYYPHPHTSQRNENFFDGNHGEAAVAHHPPGSSKNHPVRNEEYHYATPHYHHYHNEEFYAHHGRDMSHHSAVDSSGTGIAYAFYDDNKYYHDYYHAKPPHHCYDAHPTQNSGIAVESDPSKEWSHQYYQEQCAYQRMPPLKEQNTHSEPLQEMPLVRNQPYGYHNHHNAPYDSSSSIHSGQLPPFYSRRLLPLATSDDENWLSEFLCFVRSECVEVFKATSEDVAARMNSKKVLQGQVGIRCKFCAHLPHRERTGRSSSFPSSIDRIYQSLTMMLRDHFPKCNAMPPELRERYFSLKANASQGATDSKRYWIDSAHILGLRDTADAGIRFSRSPPNTP